LEAAQVICAQIESTQPDLVIALLHSAEAQLRAVMALWEETHTAPFPPVVRTNLGKEKLDRYMLLRDRLGRGAFNELLFGSADAAHLLAWVADQRIWQEELVAQVEAVMGQGAQPSHILVVDDFYFEGATWILTLGLLRQAFPQAETQQVAGYLKEWRQSMSLHWLHDHYPDAWARLVAAGQAERQRGTYPTCLDAPGWIATGTDDIHAESLYWQPITAAHEVVQSLATFLPAETWLTMPGWIYATIEAFVRRRAREGLAPVSLQGAWKTFHLLPRRLTPTLLMLAHAWREHRVARREVVTLARITPREATRLLQAWAKHGFLIRRGRGGGTYYELAGKFGILAYGSLLADPGDFVAWATERRIDGVMTPYEVEYAHANCRRAGAPTLVPVPDGKGARVLAYILVVRPDMEGEAAADILYRRETDRIGDLGVYCCNGDQANEQDGVSVEVARDLAGVPHVFYARPNPNLDFVLRDDLPNGEKAERLARLAADSVTAETFAAGQDGIRYLADAIRQGVRTPLTELYEQAVLRLAGDAPDLEEARRRIGRWKGLV